MLSRHWKSLVAVLATGLLLVSQSSGQKPMHPVLSRDIDKRLLPGVALQSLPSKMRDAVQTFVNEAKHDAGVSGTLHAAIRSIPVAPRSHKLYLVQLSGEIACAPAGVNCMLAVFDETQGKVNTVVNGQFADVIVIRRPHLQMPDIGAREQLGHFANDMTVYRFAGDKWLPYACKETSITGNDDLHPEFVADAKCTR